MSDIIEKLLAREPQPRTAPVLDFDARTGTVEAVLVPYEVEVPLGPKVSEIVTRGAFSRADVRRVKVFDQQHSGPVIGRALDLEDRDDGVFARLQISDTALGRDVLTLLRDGALTEMSIEFIPQPRYMKVDKAGDGSTKIRHDRATLLGVSPVSHGAYGQHAKVLAVRSELDALAREEAEEVAAAEERARREEVRRRELAEIASYDSGPQFR